MNKQQADAIIIALTAFIALVFVISMFFQDKVSKCNQELLDFEFRQLNQGHQEIEDRLDWTRNIILHRSEEASLYQNISTQNIKSTMIAWYSRADLLKECKPYFIWNNNLKWVGLILTLIQFSFAFIYLKRTKWGS